jgi:hypothetical protein
MPKQLTADPTHFPAQTSPVSGESRTASSVETPFQNAADRSAWVKARIEYVDPSGDGARRLRRVASIAALRALTDLTDGVCIVDGVGLFAYLSGSTITEAEPFVIKPTSVGGGSGRWVWDSSGSLGAANGIVQAGSDGFVPTAKLSASGGGAKILGASIVNGLVGLSVASYAGPFTTTSASYVDVGTVSAAFTAEINDIIILLGQAFMRQDDGSAATHVTRWQVTKPDTSNALVGASEVEHIPAANTQPIGLPIGAFYTAVAAGTHTFKLQQKISGGVTGAVKNVNLVALHLRP